MTIPACPVGTARINSHGYTLMKVAENPSVWMLAHRWAMEKKIGRKLYPNEPVHHTCHDGACYEPDHLEMIEWGMHTRLHHLGRKQRRQQVEERTTRIRLWWSVPGNKKARSEQWRARWADPDFRARMAVARQYSWARRQANGKPHNSIGRKDTRDVVEKRSESLRRYYATHKQEASEAAKKRWADPEYRAKQRVALLARWARSRSAPAELRP